MFICLYLLIRYNFTEVSSWPKS